MEQSLREKFRKRQGKLQRHILRVGMRHVVLFLLWPILFLLLLYMNFRTVSRLAMQNVEYSGDAQVMEFVLDFDNYLADGVAMLDSVAYNVDKLIRVHAEDRIILDFLERESSSLDEGIAQYTEGVYGFVRGTYMDGIGWVPEEGYVPAERPWYVDAVEAGGATTYVAPYIDSYSGDRIMTISKVLSDGESVIAMDFKINEMQNITEQISARQKSGAVVILDEDGTVVAHSNPTELDKNYLEQNCGVWSVIAKKLLINKESNFRLTHYNDQFLVFTRVIGGGWYVLSVCDANVMLAGVYKLVVFGVITCVIGLIFIVGAMISITKRGMVAEDINENLQSISGIYVSMHKIDMIADTYEEINCMVGDLSALLRSKKKTSASATMKMAIETLTDELSKDDMLEFTDLSTLNDRMLNTDTMTREFLGSRKRWCRGRFIAVEREAQGRIKRVLWMVEVIDEEKRARDQLLYLSETDRMTGINNRGCGENKIRHQLLDGPGGMFLLMDVDNFKTVNDNYGHHMGDEVLIAIADCMRRVFREQDIIMRLGGDEFAAFLPQVFDEAGGRALIDRLLNSIRMIHIEGFGEQSVNVSIGATFCRTAEERLTFDQLYKQADSCTYESKKHRGSWVTFYKVGEGLLSKKQKSDMT